MPLKKKKEAEREAAEALKAEKLNAQREQELLEERARNIERIEVEAKQRSLRTAVLSDSVQSFENLLHKVREYKKAISDEDEWQNYLKCDDLPDTKKPSDIRSFIYEWQNSLNNHWEQQINWWLKCDDRSVLTQIPEAPDVRRKMMQKLQEPIGKFFDQKLRLLIKVYNSLSDTIRRRKVSSTRYEDLLTIRDAFRETVSNFLDVLTFQVLLHVDREMISMNALMSNYSFSAPDFRIFVWSFKDVPLPENYNGLKMIKMDPLNIIIKISNRFDLAASSVRGLWLKHDFLSDYCQSFNLPMPMKFKDLATSVSEEMAVRKMMTEKHLDRMRKEREAYDLMMEEKLKLEEAAKSSKKKAKAVVPSKKVEKKKKSTKKASKVPFIEPVVPPVVDESTYIDVESEYLVFEAAQVLEDFEPYKPENLGLSEHEVNMRNFQVSNGVFKIECFERPSQTKEINYQMFLRLNEIPNIIKLQKFHHIYEEPIVKVKKDERKSQIEKKIVDARQAALDDLMKVEVKLNTKFFWWELPTVCRWEPLEESEKFKFHSQEFSHHFDSDEKRRESFSSASDKKHFKNPKIIKDFDLSSSQKDFKLSELFKNYIVPIMPDDFEFFDDKLRKHELKRREWLDVLEQQTEQKISQVTKEEFNEKFEMKVCRPRELFQVERCQLLKTKENPEEVKKVLEARKKSLEERNKFKYEKDDELKPIKNEHKLLGELLQEIATANAKLQPTFHHIGSTKTISSVSSTDFKNPKRNPLEKFAPRKLRVSSRSSKRSPSISRLSKMKPVQLEASALLSQPSISSSKVSFARTVQGSFDVLVSEMTVDDCISPNHSTKQQSRGKWSTQDIYEESFDAETKTVTFYTGRLGTFAFATRKYSNLPLKSWEIYPEFNENEKSVLLKVETQNVNVDFKITNHGYTFKIFFSKKLPPQEIKVPVKISELKKILSSLNMNLFPEADASFYIEDNCEKHKTMEFHTYKSMAVYCLSHNFKRSVWNRSAHRRVAIFDSRMILKKSFKTIMTTPLTTASVDVHEKFTNLDVVELDYEMNPIAQEFHPDLLNFLDDEVDKREHRASLKNFMLIWFVQVLLMNIQPLSFSL